MCDIHDHYDYYDRYCLKYCVLFFNLCVHGGSIDGATVLRMMKPEHPVAKLLVQLSQTQDREVGDGTTGVVLLTAALLRRALEVVQRGVHTHLIARGYRLALEHSLLQIDRIKEPLIQSETGGHTAADGHDHDNKDLRREMLRRIVQLPLNSKLLSHDQTFFADMIVRAVELVGAERFNAQSVHIVPIVGDTLRDSFLVDGIVFSKSFVYAGYEQQPKHIERPKILLLNHEIELKHQKEFARLVINDPSQYNEFVDTEWQLVYRKLQQIYDTECTLVLDQQAIGDLATQHFAQRGISNISRIPEQVMQAIASAVGGTILSSLENIGSTATNDEFGIFGTCDLFEERNIGDERYCILSGCQGGAGRGRPRTVTMVVRGSSEEVVQEAVRSLHDAISVCSNVLQDPYFVYGGGATEMFIRESLEAICTGSDEGTNAIASQLHRNPKLVDCIMSFAQSMEDVVHILANNSGLDAASIGAELRHIHHNKQLPNWWRHGIDIWNECTGDMERCNVLEPVAIKRHAIMTATEAACLILSIDYVIQKPVVDTTTNPPKEINSE